MTTKFHPNTARSFSKYKAYKNFTAFPHSVIFIIALSLSVLSPAIILFGSFSQNNFISSLFTFIWSCLFCLVLYAFLRSYNQPLQDINSENLAESLNEYAIEVVLKAVSIARENNFSEISPIVLLRD